MATSMAFQPRSSSKQTKNRDNTGYQPPEGNRQPGSTSSGGKNPLKAIRRAFRSRQDETEAHTSEVDDLDKLQQPSIYQDQMLSNTAAYRDKPHPQVPREEHEASHITRRMTSTPSEDLVVSSARPDLRVDIDFSPNIAKDQKPQVEIRRVESPSSYRQGDDTLSHISQAGGRSLGHIPQRTLSSDHIAPYLPQSLVEPSTFEVDIEGEQPFEERLREEVEARFPIDQHNVQYNRNDIFDFLIMRFRGTMDKVVEQVKREYENHLDSLHVTNNRVTRKRLPEASTSESVQYGNVSTEGSSLPVTVLAQNTRTHGETIQANSKRAVVAQSRDVPSDFDTDEAASKRNDEIARMDRQMESMRSGDTEQTYAPSQSAELARNAKTIEQLRCDRDQDAATIKQLQQALSRNADQFSRDLAEKEQYHTDFSQDLQRRNVAAVKKTEELHQTAIAELKNELEYLDIKYEKDLQELKARLDEEHEESESLKMKVETHRRQISELENQKRMVSNAHDSELRELNDNLNEARSQHERIVGRANDEMRRQTQSHEVELAACKRDYRGIIDGLKQELGSAQQYAKHEFDSLQAQYQTAMQRVQSLQAEHQSTVAEYKLLQTQHVSVVNDRQVLQTQLKQDRAIFQARIQELENTLKSNESDAIRSKEQLQALHLQAMAQCQDSHAKLLDDLKESHAQEKRELQQAHQTKEERLIAKRQEDRESSQVQLQVLRESLLARDEKMYVGSMFFPKDLPRKSDDKLKADFLVVQRMVEDLGGAWEAWKSEQSLWSQQIMSKIIKQHGERLSKKVVLQDIIWKQLFEHIFGSPYRVFGEEGKVLDKEWAQQCGGAPSDDIYYAWPPPSFKAERWRYMTMCGCRDTLQNSFSEKDPRVQLKKGFLGTMNHLAARLKEELGGIVELQDEQIKMIEKLSKRAAKTWIDFQGHRCRIVVRLAGLATKSTLDTIARISKGPTLLTILPTLGRYGDSDGKDLGMFTNIAGCSGESFRIT